MSEDVKIVAFHDKVHSDFEEANRKASRELMIWLGTIAPCGTGTAQELSYHLLCLAKDMGWETEEDEMIGEIIK